MAEQENRVMDLHGEVMACAYEDVQVMWSILDKSKSTTCDVASWWNISPKPPLQTKKKKKNAHLSAVSN